MLKVVMISHSKSKSNNEPLDLNEFIQNNAGLVVCVVNKLKPEQKFRDDYIQLGYIGLWKAYKKFDQSLGYKFSTIAYTCIKREILKFKIKEAKHNYKPYQDTSYYTNDKIEELVPNNLTKKEKSVLKLRLQNYKMLEITKILNLSSRHVTQRIYKSAINKIKVANE